MRLKSMVVADPVRGLAELMTRQCRRLASKHIITATCRETLEAVENNRPPLAVVSLELPDMPPEALVKELASKHPDILLIATYRELSVQRIEKLSRAGFDALIAQPVDVTDIFRVAAGRWRRRRTHRQYF